METSKNRLKKSLEVYAGQVNFQNLGNLIRITIFALLPFKSFRLRQDSKQDVL